MHPMTHTAQCTGPAACLLMAFELGQRSWKLGFTVGFGQRPRIRQLRAGAVEALAVEVGRAKTRLELPATAAVVSCYEAGRDGFWIHRWLETHGITNYVVDSSSIEVSRRARRAKTDRLDLVVLLHLLTRYHQGDRRVWRVVRVPSVAAEDARQLSRTLDTVTRDRTRAVNRIKGLLAPQGIRLPVDAALPAALEAARGWDARPVPAGLQARVESEWTHLQQLNHRRAALTAAQRQDRTTPAGRLMAQLQTLRGIGPIGARILTTEVFAWRQIRNRRELGALAGLVPSLYQSGDYQRDQGISRAGNAHVRRVMVQRAWSGREGALALGFTYTVSGVGDRYTARIEAASEPSAPPMKKPPTPGDRPRVTWRSELRHRVTRSWWGLLGGSTQVCPRTTETPEFDNLRPHRSPLDATPEPARRPGRSVWMDRPRCRDDSCGVAGLLISRQRGAIRSKR